MLCPFCKEEIIEGAIKCKHCGSMLNSPESVANQKIKEKVEYSDYSQVPWYRKVWFFNLATLLFWPAAVYVLLTGNVYFVKKGKVRPIGVINKIFVFLWAAIFTYLIITQGLGIGGGGTYVNMVKEGNYKDYPNIEIGKAFDNFFSNPKWKHFTSENGENVVEFDGNFMFAEKEAEAKIQYVVGDDSFRVATFAINGEIQNEIVYASLMEKVFESSKNSETETTNGDEKALLMTALGDLKSIMNAIESYITDNSVAPAAGSIIELSKLKTFVPLHIKSVPIKDPWGNDYYYEGGTHKDLYIISSIGPDKVKGTSDDIVYSNGQLLEEKYPDLAQIEKEEYKSDEPLTENTVQNQAASLISGKLILHGEWASLNYVGEESGDWVPYFFKIDSDVGKTILATYKEGDFCEINAVVKTMEIPPQGVDISNASEVNEIVSVEQKK